MNDEKKEIAPTSVPNEPEAIEAEELDEQALESVAGGQLEESSPVIVNEMQCYC